MWARIQKHWFLVALAVVFLIGFFGAAQFEPLIEMTLLRAALVFAVMWTMGITLEASAIQQSLTRPLPSIVAIAINVCVAPVLCWPLVTLLPTSLAGGMWVASLVPCTVASASVWTRRAGGDDSIAMMTTVATNLACVVVVPLGLSWVLSQQTDFDLLQQIQRLFLLVILPLAVAQTMRRLGAAGWADRVRPHIATLGQVGILFMVLIGATASALTLDDATPGFSNGIALVILGAACVHVLALMVGIRVARALSMQPSQQIAVGISGSQKTLTVGLQVAIDCGVSVIPMLAYHLSQLLVDTVVADRWADKRTRDANRLSTPPADAPPAGTPSAGSRSSSSHQSDA